MTCSWLSLILSSLAYEPLLLICSFNEPNFYPMCSWHLVLNFSCGDFFNRMLKMFTSYLAARYGFTDPDVFSKQLQGFKSIAAREAKNSHLLKDFILFNLISRWIFCTDPLMISCQFYHISFEIVLCTSSMLRPMVNGERGLSLIIESSTLQLLIYLTPA